MNNEKIYDEIKQYLDKCQYIVFTGGEPMIQIDDIMKFISFLSQDKGLMINCGLETNGTIYSDEIFIFDRISISPKKQMYNIDILNRFNQKESKFKFVYDEDLWFEKIINELDLEPWQIYIMPEGKTKEEQEEKMIKVIEYCKQKGYNFTPRLHTLVWGDKRGI